MIRVGGGQWLSAVVAGNDQGRGWSLVMLVMFRIGGGKRWSLVMNKVEGGQWWSVVVAGVGPCRGYLVVVSVGCWCWSM